MKKNIHGLELNGWKMIDWSKNRSIHSIKQLNIDNNGNYLDIPIITKTTLYSDSYELLV